MSAIVLGKRSSFFEDNNNNIPSSPSSSSSPPVSKRIRCSSSSPVRFSPTSAASSSAAGSHSFFNLSTSLALDRLASFFPDMDKQVLQRALDECGDDMDSAIRSLTELRLGSSVENMRSTAAKFEAGDESSQKFQSQGNGAVNGEAVPVENSCTPQNLPADGAEWVELFVREMLSAANMDDARSRASRALEWLEKSIRDHANADAHRLQQENLSLKEQLQGLIQENSLLKRAVSIQHERQKEFEDRSQEVHTLKQMISQYQEQLRTLEVNNYSLTMHLKQAQQSNSIPGRFHPDVF